MNEHPSLKNIRWDQHLNEIRLDSQPVVTPTVVVESPKELKEITQKITELDQKIDTTLTLLQKQLEIVELRKELLEENLKVTQAMNAILARELNK